MTSGFYERLSAISADPNDEDGMAELVVAALGSFGRYYICWKTRSGEYKQESSGLPLPLHEWLFPTTGETRDLPTLQVVLGHGDDFFASDAHGKVERKAPTPDRTSSSPQPAPANDTPPNPALNRASRRRSRTMSLVGTPPGFRLSQSLLSVSPITEGAPSRSNSISRTTRPPPPSYSSSSSSASSSLLTPFVPAPLTRVRTERDWKRRPRSIAFGEEDYIPSPQAPLLRRKASRGKSSSPPPPQPSKPCTCGCHAAAGGPTQQAGQIKPTPVYATTSAQTEESKTPLPPPPSRKSTYVNAAIQTDPLPSPPPSQPRRRRSASRRETRSPSRSRRRAVSTSSSSTSDYEDDGASTASGSRRSSAAATDITTPSTYNGGVPVKGNPVVMGQMQSYFRSSGYQLGDALRPVGVFGGSGGGGFGDGFRGGMMDGGLAMAWRELLDRRRTV